MLEDEAFVESLQPKKMKSFSESHKSDKSSLIMNEKSTAPPPKEATPTEAGEINEAEGAIAVKESPRNKAILKRLATRERGSRLDSKKSTGKKYVIKCVH